MQNLTSQILTPSVICHRRNPPHASFPSGQIMTQNTSNDQTSSSDQQKQTPLGGQYRIPMTQRQYPHSLKRYAQAISECSSSSRSRGKRETSCFRIFKQTVTAPAVGLKQVISSLGVLSTDNSGITPLMQSQQIA
ncbi:hypothetical protein FGO68_gene7116 [Halteria grandinella]|uniref:Uncharacterized protein n=1 Tax=Halteria grandinella TaxID=5974 RepID=A0A8J8SVD8_HALGN|nr:hypothetical protein FGO68_gene7116 [Halteria grandinella]